MEKIFSTSDVYLAGALVLLLKASPEYRLQHGRVLFCFPQSDDLYRAINDFNGGCELNVSLYAEVVKRIRGEMLSKKGRGRGL